METVRIVEKTLGCKTCDEGKLDTFLVDGSGCGVGESPKLPGHAVDDYHWHCCHNTEPFANCPLCGPPPKICLCGCPDWAHQPDCQGVEDFCENGCAEFQWDGIQASWL